MAHDPDVPSAIALLEKIGGHRVTAVIHAAARLGVADLLLAGPKTSEDLARLADAHAPSLHRLLQALVTIGLCTPAGGAFALTSMGRRLATEHPQSLKPWALMEGEFLRRSWEGLVETVRTGKSGPELAGVSAEARFEALEEMGNASLFNSAMVALTRLVAPGVVSAYDFGGIANLMDVGGGHGELLGCILRAHPSMRGSVYDLPHCEEGARRHLTDLGVANRSEFVAGSFFESVPATADALILKSIIHDWDDERSLKILRNCRRALPDSGKLLLVERILPSPLAEDPQHASIALSDLNMMRGPGGAERTEREYGDLLAAAGFRMKRILPGGLFQVIEGTCA